MKPLPKCLLIPIDDTPESVNPVEFLSRLYPDRKHINIILSYFLPPLAPVYEGKPASKAMAEKKKELEKNREEAARLALDRAREALLKAGFEDEMIQESMEEKKLSSAHQACRLADIKKVDAVVVNRQVSSRLEGFLKGDPTSSLLNHCLLSPVWFTSRQADPARAAICMYNEEASLRAADHAAFMLAETGTKIDLVHASSKVGKSISSPTFEPSEDMKRWLQSSDGKGIAGVLEEAGRIVREAGIGEERVETRVIPAKGKIASGILDYCRRNGIGIVVLGHSEPEGMFGFFKGSLTKQILPETHNLSVWVQQ
jgi:nucleotide-binding universal stress UspA family protein